MLRKILTTSLSVTGAGILLAVAGCGTGAPAVPRPPSAASLMSDIRASFDSANSVRIIGHSRLNGRVATLDMSLFWSGAMKGTIQVGRQAIELVRAGGHTYLYVNQALLNLVRRSHNIPAYACPLMCGKYLRVPNRLFSGLSLKSLVRQMEMAMSKVSKASRKPGKKLPVLRVRLTTFNGQRAWELFGHGIEAFIAQNSTSYLLGLVQQKFGALRFSEWNAVPPIRAPSADQIFPIPLPLQLP